MNPMSLLVFTLKCRQRPLGTAHDSIVSISSIDFRFSEAGRVDKDVGNLRAWFATAMGMR